MSGISLAVAPRSDPDNGAERQPSSAMLRGVMGSLRVIELQLFAFIMVFSMSGLVPLIDLAFPVVTTLYLLALSRLAFPSLHSKLDDEAATAHSAASQEIFRGSKLFQVYVVMGTTMGLFLPLAHVLGGFARGDDATVRSATPHLFLLSCQILMENIVGSLGVFSTPLRALVPLLYTVRRVFVIVDWVYDVWTNKLITRTTPVQDKGRGGGASAGGDEVAAEKLTAATEETKLVAGRLGVAQDAADGDGVLPRGLPTSTARRRAPPGTTPPARVGQWQPDLTGSWPPRQSDRRRVTSGLSRDAAREEEERSSFRDWRWREETRPGGRATGGEEAGAAAPWGARGGRGDLRSEDREEERQAPSPHPLSSQPADK